MGLYFLTSVLCILFAVLLCGFRQITASVALLSPFQPFPLILLIFQSFLSRNEMSDFLGMFQFKLVTVSGLTVVASSRSGSVPCLSLSIASAQPGFNMHPPV